MTRPPGPPDIILYPLWSVQPERGMRVKLLTPTPNLGGDWAGVSWGGGWGGLMADLVLQPLPAGFQG